MHLSPDFSPDPLRISSLAAVTAQFRHAAASAFALLAALPLAAATAFAATAFAAAIVAPACKDTEHAFEGTKEKGRTSDCEALESRLSHALPVASCHSGTTVGTSAGTSAGTTAGTPAGTPGGMPTTLHLNAITEYVHPKSGRTKVPNGLQLDANAGASQTTSIFEILGKAGPGPAVSGDLTLTLRELARFKASGQQVEEVPFSTAPRLYKVSYTATPGELRLAAVEDPDGKPLPCETGFVSDAFLSPH